MVGNPTLSTDCIPVPQSGPSLSIFFWRVWRASCHEHIGEASLEVGTVGFEKGGKHLFLWCDAVGKRDTWLFWGVGLPPDGMTFQWNIRIWDTEVRPRQTSNWRQSVRRLYAAGERMLRRSQHGFLGASLLAPHHFFFFITTIVLSLNTTPTTPTSPSTISLDYCVRMKVRL